jgi:DNA-directed RNA polymerase subunit RPC12/RpoP
VTGLTIDECPSCEAMNEREEGEPAVCEDCGAHLVPRPLYECVGCGARMEGPPSEPPAFESPISNNNCGLCEFVREELIGELDIT